MKDLHCNLAGLELSNPIMTASGTFGYGLEYAPYGELRKLGGLVVKGLSLEPRSGNPGPRIVETPCGLLNAIGLQNIGASSFVQDKLPGLPWKETPIIANLYAQSRDEFAELGAYLAQFEEIAGLEVNVSCPNVAKGGTAFGQDPGQAAAVCRAVKDVSGAKPVMVKLTPNVTDIRAMAVAVQDAGADVISLINTLSGMAVDISTRRPKLANIHGGLSGPAIKPVALHQVYQVCQEVSIPVIGLGGISSARDILEFILVGAQAVQIGSANFLRPDMSFRLVDELQTLTEELEISSWDEWRGSLKVE
ncbi:dihydroorotate dehydrogenase [Desulfovermiculus halophilus]|jgi:dihydroorotate dehydrogenase (NAD+) catalytic subunit|uniref:dihydroorotate dehydrogenase n=1 Tax=Desulfovermiculus halophilus TaxID=339722 RepID=UPI000484DFFD|nr:dihydroorotate dehydrogenase [Desulfovermiculus halophilus]